jgi:hypothetical protein
MSTVSIPRAVKPRYYYVGMAAFMCVMVLVGFWPTFFSQLLSGIPDRHWIVHLHGWIFVGWMVLLVTQVILAASGRTQAHRSLGTLGVVYGFLVLVMGMVVAVAGPVMRFTTGDQTLDESAGFMIIPLGDMILFAGFFISAVVYRRRPEIHKRFILLATTALLFAAVGRMQFMPLPVGTVLWFSPVLIGMAYDKSTRGGVHPVYWIGLVAMVIGMMRLALLESEFWLPIGRALVRMFA